ncbi:MAG: hypothetical protein LBH15_00745 [Treponema sp.]|jgi:hypothetical protein|nr:hypothetical protein [Treponema sp.]
MRHFWGIFIFVLVVNSAFCEELFVASDYYTIDSDKKIVRFINYRYSNGRLGYTYVLSLYEDDNIGIEMAYRTGHVYLVAYYKNPDRSVFEHSDELFRQFSYHIKFIEPIKSYNKIIDKNGDIDIIEETNDIFGSFFDDHGIDRNDFRRGNYIEDRNNISQTPNYYFLVDISYILFKDNTNIIINYLLSELEIQFPYNDGLRTFIYNTPEDIHLIKKMLSIAEENGLQ